jgi:hypothetical protein
VLGEKYKLRSSSLFGTLQLPDTSSLLRDFTACLRFSLQEWMQVVDGRVSCNNGNACYKCIIWRVERFRYVNMIWKNINHGSPCNPYVNRRFGGSDHFCLQQLDARCFLARLIFGSKDAGDTLLRNVGSHAEYMARFMELRVLKDEASTRMRRRNLWLKIVVV